MRCYWGLPREGRRKDFPLIEIDNKKTTGREFEISVGMWDWGDSGTGSRAFGFQHHEVRCWSNWESVVHELNNNAKSYTDTLLCSSEAL